MDWDDGIELTLAGLTAAIGRRWSCRALVGWASAPCSHPIKQKPPLGGRKTGA
jgi:hypothetical protein